MESKIVATERLRRENRWEEASAFKDAALREFKAKGMKRAEASEAAWSAMLEEFPPPPDVQAEGGDCDPGVHPAIPDTWGEIPDSAPFDVEANWAHQNLALVVEERPSGPARLHWDRARSQAPSYGAMSLLQFAASSRKGFFDMLARIKRAAVEESDEAARREGELQLAEIGMQIKQAVQECEDRLLGVKGSLQTDVRDAVSEWASRFGLALSDDAESTLATRVAGLVQGHLRTL